ncbi:MAG: amidohydrolase family protein [Acidimicrobiia bacterium]
MHAFDSVEHRVFDADNHYYEPVDLFARYIEPAYRDRTFTTERRDDGTAVLYQGRVFGFVAGSGNRQRIRPGSLRAMLRGQQLPDTDEDDSYASDREARLALMDQQGIDATLMFPSTGVTVANVIGDDIELRAVHMRAFNRWIADTWGFNAEDRIFSPAVMDLADPDAAIAEIDKVLALGARAIQILPGPALWSTPERPGRSPADAIYDPFWERVNEAKVLVCLHLGNAGYMEHYSADWGESTDPDGVRSNDGSGTTSLKAPDGKGTGRTAFQWTMMYRDRPVMETIAAMIYHNLFGRFPNVQVASVENGSIWVPYLLRAMDNMKGMGRNGPWPNGYVEGRPSEIFKRHVYVSPHHYGEDVGALAELLGTDRVMFGSDFPHAEGMSGVADYQERTGEFVAKLKQPADVTRGIMHDNGYRALGLVAS